MRSKLFKYLMVIIFGMFLCGILIYLWGIPTIGHIITQNFPEFSYCYYPWLIFLWCTGIPCFIVLGYMWKISASIFADQAFTSRNAIRLKRIAQLAAFNVIFFFAGNIIFLFLNMSHPSILICSLGIDFVGIAISVIAQALSKLATKAAALQDQYDLTI